MSEFDRTETFRRSIRRPRKPLIQTTQVLNEVFDKNKKKLLSQREFVASVPSGSNDQMSTSTDPCNEIEFKDYSQSALMEIQKHIDQIELNSAIQRDVLKSSELGFKENIVMTRYDEMESLLKTGISDVVHDEEIGDRTESKRDELFLRSSVLRSSVQGVPVNSTNKAIKHYRPIVRTSSDGKHDSRHIDFLRKHRKIKGDENKMSKEVKKTWNW